GIGEVFLLGDKELTLMPEQEKVQERLLERNVKKLSEEKSLWLQKEEKKEKFEER
ncbi:unnamed protein product, partial [marine sediment metagenome]